MVTNRMYIATCADLDRPMHAKEFSLTIWITNTSAWIVIFGSQAMTQAFLDASKTSSLWMQLWMHLTVLDSSSGEEANLVVGCQPAQGWKEHTATYCG